MRQVKKPVAVMVNAKLQRTSKAPVERYRIHVIDRAAQILDCFGFDHQELSVSEIGAKTGLHRSTAHRILMALEYNDLIKQNPSTGKYHLGIKLFKLGHQAVSQLNLREICRPFLSRLMNDTKETIHLAVLDDDQVLYLDKVEGPHALRMPSRVGRYIPTYCTSLGKAMLSCLDDQEVKSILRRQTLKPHTENTVKNINQLLADLGSVRKRGYAVDNEEIEIGLRCVGAPLRDYTGGMVGAISVAAPSARLSEKNTPVIGRMVIAIAAGISEKLGFEKPKTAQAQ
ncbi:MAG TPA: IclR family transcriptional regulator [Candidatus Binatia bacterium]|jgi:IclR family transcriptional regulator, KDG regulon repressor|nr:IclR family transcriptional regulator [Candidatus Binatia bacterium]